MFLPNIDINSQSVAADIVRQDYRTADIFKKYDITYCCGGRWPLEIVCQTNGVRLEKLLEELSYATRTLYLSPALPFEKWSIDFLTEYITNVHHQYLYQTLPALGEALGLFIQKHPDKYPEYGLILQHFDGLEKEIIPHLRQEEEVIFPYLKQVAHAYEGKDAFAGLLVKTLRKPVARIMEMEHEIIETTMQAFRGLTANYTPPPQACASHRIILSKLKELDNDIAQHVYLENTILFPRIIAMEKQLLD